MTDREGRVEKGRDDPEALVDEASVESFPASDPPAWEPAHAGPPTPPVGEPESPEDSGGQSDGRDAK